MRVLITGVSGFVGSYLAEEYLKNHVEVHGTVRERSDLSNIEAIKDRVVLHHADVVDALAVDRLVSQGFNVIHNLAAVTYVPTSWEYPSEVFQTNTVGTLNFLESLRNRKSQSIFHLSSSCETYGRVEEHELPVKETNPLRPTSPYAISKLAADMLCQTYAHAYGVRTVITRAFNHSGERRGSSFLTKTVCRQAAEIVRGRRQQFLLGNTTPVRDWTDVRDICSAYMLAVQHAGTDIAFGEPYNVCSGVGISVRELVEYMAGFANIPDKVATDPSKMRPLENPRLVGDATRFANATGWKARYPILGTLKDIYMNELVRIDRAENS